MLRDRKITVVAFVNPTSLNSLRALEALKAWYERYALHQLMVIGVVTPELDVQRDAAWVRETLRRQGVDFPVFIDGDRRLWRAYANDGWPSLYLLDRKGRIAFDRLGEGGYREFEEELRDALADLIGEDKLPPPVKHPEPPAKGCGRATGEILLGGRAKAPPLRLDEDRSKRALFVGDARDGEVATRGRWDAERDGLRLGDANARQENFLRVVWTGSQALAVLAPGEKRPARVFVKQDEQWLHEGNAGGDIRFDDDGRSFVAADSVKLYDLVRDAGERPHELYLIPESRGAAIYGLSFADACLVTKLP